MMLGFKKEKKDDDTGTGANPFIGLEKTSVLQETRTFNETPLSNRKCIQVLAKIIFMINQGEQMGPTEAREAFFATTRLFQSKDVTLRRMVHLVIKELPTAPDDAIIATSSLTKDMTGKEDGYRATAIRALCKITDMTMLTAIERYLKQAIVDKNPAVSSAALVSTLHLGKDGSAGEMVKRWTNEINEALNSDNIMVQYHALGLMYSVKKQDRLAVSKLLAKYTRGGIKSPYACCFLIRICCKVIEENSDDNHAPLVEFLEACLRHKSEIVIYEAARALVNLPNVTGREIAPAISVLQLFLSSPKPTLRFAAVKTLNKVAISHPSSVTMCNLDLEHLISDSNRSIATLAITTLLKTGSEGSIERLMRQIQSFMTEIPDEFKIIVIEAIQSLCLKFPKKHMVMMNLLATMLREEGGYDYKAAIVNTLIAIIEQNPGSQDTGLYHLCEFIEDCEHGVLATKILHLLGREGPKTATPSKFIRYIYNRVILENPTVRAAAVTSLAKFGALCLDLQPSILVLLRRCLYDSHDEVRDRATFYLSVLESQNTALANHYIIDTLQSSIVGLQSLLVHYIEGQSEEPFNLNTVPITTAPAQLTTPSSKTEDSTDRKSAAPKKTRQEEFAEKLAQIPQFASLGPLFKTCAKPIELSESETEYYVQCNVHTFQRHLVLQFDLLNTLNDQLLENVKVEVEGEDYTVLGHIPCPSLPYNEPGTSYTLLELPEEPTDVASTFACTLKFMVKDCDPTTGEADPEGYEDEYVLEDLDIGLNCLFQRVFKPSFNTSWEDMGQDSQAEQTYTLSTMKCLPSAVDQITAFLGMQPCERSEKVPEGKSSHTLLLAGQFKGGIDCLVRAKLAFDGAVSMNICARSGDPMVSELIVSSIG